MDYYYFYHTCDQFQDFFYVKNTKMIKLLMKNDFKLLVFATEILDVLYAMVFTSKLEPILCLQDVPLLF